MSTEIADVVVVGTGAVGAAASYQLALRGVDVLAIDRFHPPHNRGSSHGETRVTRVATGEGPEYVPFVRRSHEIWRQLEGEIGKKLLDQCGFLAIDGSDGQALRHGRPGFFDTTLAIARECDISHELLTPQDVAARHPEFLLRGDERIYFEPGAGLVYPESAIAAQIDRARILGARFGFDETVLEIRESPSQVTVVTSDRIISASQTVIAAGAWTPQLAEEQGLALLPQMLHWFDLTDPSLFAANRFPTFIWLHGPRAEDTVYGFPRQGDTVKLATEQFTMSVGQPDELESEFTGADPVRFIDEHVKGRIAGIAVGSVRTESCLYTHTHDGRFIIDRKPHSDRILVVSACSGHGFKHSAAVGEYVADLVSGAAPLVSFFQRKQIKRPTIFENLIAALPH